MQPPIIHYNGMPSKDLAVGIFGLMQGQNVSI
jgi:hypothetical protein